MEQLEKVQETGKKKWGIEKISVNPDKRWSKKTGEGSVRREDAGGEGAAVEAEGAGLPGPHGRDGCTSEACWAVV